MLNPLRPAPANDVLERLRPLTPTDVRAALKPRALVLGTVIDSAFTSDHPLAEDPIKLAVFLLSHSPDLCLEIVWRGTWLKKEQVAALHPSAFVAAVRDILHLSRQEDPDNRLEATVIDVLRPFCNSLQRAEAR